MNRKANRDTRGMMHAVIASAAKQPRGRGTEVLGCFAPLAMTESMQNPPRVPVGVLIHGSNNEGTRDTVSALVF